jgi:hypothetical protein
MEPYVNCWIQINMIRDGCGTIDPLTRPNPSTYQAPFLTFKLHKTISEPLLLIVVR